MMRIISNRTPIQVSLEFNRTCLSANETNQKSTKCWATSNVHRLPTFSLFDWKRKQTSHHGITSSIWAFPVRSRVSLRNGSRDGHTATTTRRPGAPRGEWHSNDRTFESLFPAVGHLSSPNKKKPPPPRIIFFPKNLKPQLD